MLKNSATQGTSVDVHTSAEVVPKGEPGTSNGTVPDVTGNPSRPCEGETTQGNTATSDIAQHNDNSDDNDNDNDDPPPFLMQALEARQKRIVRAEVNHQQRRHGDEGNEDGETEDDPTDLQSLPYPELFRMSLGPLNTVMIGLGYLPIRRLGPFQWVVRILCLLIGLYRVGFGVVQLAAGAQSVFSWITFFSAYSLALVSMLWGGNAMSDKSDSWYGLALTNLLQCGIGGRPSKAVAEKRMKHIRHVNKVHCYYVISILAMGTTLWNFNRFVRWVSGKVPQEDYPHPELFHAVGAVYVFWLWLTDAVCYGMAALLGFLVSTVFYIYAHALEVHLPEGLEYTDVHTVPLLPLGFLQQVRQGRVESANGTDNSNTTRGNDDFADDGGREMVLSHHEEEEVITIDDDDDDDTNTNDNADNADNCSVVATTDTSSRLEASKMGRQELPPPSLLPVAAKLQSARTMPTPEQGAVVETSPQVTNNTNNTNNNNNNDDDDDDDGKGNDKDKDHGDGDGDLSLLAPSALPALPAPVFVDENGGYSFKKEAARKLGLVKQRVMGYDKLRADSIRTLKFFLPYFVAGLVGATFLQLFGTVVFVLTRGEDPPLFALWLPPLAFCIAGAVWVNIWLLLLPLNKSSIRLNYTEEPHEERTRRLVLARTQTKGDLRLVQERIDEGLDARRESIIALASSGGKELTDRQKEREKVLQALESWKETAYETGTLEEVRFRPVLGMMSELLIAALTLGIIMAVTVTPFVAILPRVYFDASSVSYTPEISEPTTSSLYVSWYVMRNFFRIPLVNLVPFYPIVFTLRWSRVPRSLKWCMAIHLSLCIIYSCFAVLYLESTLWSSPLYVLCLIVSLVIGVIVSRQPDMLNSWMWHYFIFIAVVLVSVWVYSFIVIPLYIEAEGDTTRAFIRIAVHIPLSTLAGYAIRLPCYKMDNSQGSRNSFVLPEALEFGLQLVGRIFFVNIDSLGTQVVMGILLGLLHLSRRVSVHLGSLVFQALVNHRSPFVTMHDLRMYVSSYKVHQWHVHRTLQSMLFEFTSIFLAGFMSLLLTIFHYQEVSISDSRFLIISIFLQITIELFFDIISLRVETLTLNLPMVTLWQLKRYRYLFVGVVVGITGALHFADAFVAMLSIGADLAFKKCGSRC